MIIPISLVEAFPEEFSCLCFSCSYIRGEGRSCIVWFSGLWKLFLKINFLVHSIEVHYKLEIAARNQVFNYNVLVWNITSIHFFNMGLWKYVRGIDVNGRELTYEFCLDLSWKEFCTSDIESMLPIVDTLRITYQLLVILILWTLLLFWIIFLNRNLLPFMSDFFPTKRVRFCPSSSQRFIYCI